MKHVTIPESLAERRALMRQGYQYIAHDGKRARARRLRQLATQGKGFCVSCTELRDLAELQDVNGKRVCTPCRTAFEAEPR